MSHEVEWMLGQKSVIDFYETLIVAALPDYRGVEFKIRATESDHQLINAENS